MVFNDNIVKLEKNNKVIIMNSQNMNWVRLKKDVYDKYMSSLDRKNEFFDYVNREYQLFDMHKEEKQIPNVKSVYFCVTNMCNMECEFCTMSSSPYVDISGELDIESIKENVIPKIVKFAPKKIVVTGGEPLIRSNIIEILSLLSQTFSKEMIVLQTNGLLLNNKIIYEIGEYIGGVDISAEHFFENINMEKKLESTLKQLYEMNIPISLSFVVTSTTKDNIKKVIDICYKYNCILTVRMVSPVGRANNKEFVDDTYTVKNTLYFYYSMVEYLIKNSYYNENLSGLFTSDVFPKRCCGAFGNIVAINSTGKIYMCNNFKDDYYSFGNIIKDDYTKINSTIEYKINSDEYKNIFLVDKNKFCNECNYKFFCSGPCVAELVENENDEQHIMESCKSRIIMLEYLLFYYEKNEDVENNLRNLQKYLKNNIGM